MTFSSFQREPVRAAIDRLASVDKLAVFVGAGVAAEAGMPAWGQLVHRLLIEASKHASLRDDDQREAWAEKTMQAELPPGAAGIAQTLLRQSGVDRLGPALYRDLYTPPDGTDPLKPKEFTPGPTAHAVAALRLVCDRERLEHGKLKILTTNYDDLLERALKSRRDVGAKEVLSIYWPSADRKEPSKRIKVHHLHGVLTSKTPRGYLTLTDTSFYRPDKASEPRDHFVTGVLSDRTCIFLGTSFTDPNLMRFVFAAAEDRRAAVTGGKSLKSEPQHVAVFTHHSEDPPELRRVREEITRDRLSDAFVECVFLDHYADVSDFVFEVRKRIETRHMQHYDTRCKNVIRRIVKNTFYGNRSGQFLKAQEGLSTWLSAKLKDVAADVDRQCGSRFSSEKLTLCVWLLDESGSKLTPWLVSDRIHKDPGLIPPEPVDVNSRWLGVQALCHGTWMQTGDPQQRSSWSYIAAFPLRVKDADRGRLSIGALSLTTLTPKSDTWLHRRGPHQHELNNRLNNDIADWLLTTANEA